MNYSLELRKTINKWKPDETAEQQQTDNNFPITERKTFREGTRFYK